MTRFEKIINYTSANRLTTHVLFWVCIYIMFVNMNNFHGNPDELRIQMIETAFYVTYSVIGAYFLSYRILPPLMSSRNHIFVWVEFLIGSYLISVFARTTVIYVLEPIVRTPPFEQESFLEIITDHSKLFKAYFAQTFSLAMLFVFIKLTKDQYLIQKKALQLEKDKAETELKVLKAQLNPHFLFNTLNNIYSLSLTNSPITSKSIAVLSEILDCILYRCSAKFVPVSQEITLINNYISLEKLRYDERLIVTFNHAVDHNGQIAPLILLSLVENAFKHGAGEDMSSPIIYIDLKLINDHFEFTVRNTISKHEIPSEGEKIGLNNIRLQLEKIYPKIHTFTVTKSDTHFTAHIEINLKDQNVIKE